MQDIETAALLTPAEQAQCLALLANGASASGACRARGLSMTSFLRTYAEDESFHERVRQTGDGLSQNVAAAIYRAAMEGNVSAQKYYLQLRPPPEWMDDDAQQAADGDEALTPADLLAQYQAAGLVVPAELEALARCAAGDVES